MSTTGTRAKLAELFKRLTDPATTDLEALDAFVWFRKMRLDAGDVSGALGTPATPTGPPVTLPAQLAKPAASDGPLMPFGKFVGKSLASLAAQNPDYLRWLLTKELREPLLGQVKAALAKAGQPMPPATAKASQIAPSTDDVPHTDVPFEP